MILSLELNVDEEWGDHMAKVMVAVLGDKLYRPNASNGDDDVDDDADGEPDAGDGEGPAHDDDEMTGFGDDETPATGGDDSPTPVNNAAPSTDEGQAPAAVEIEAISEELPSPAALQGKVCPYFRACTSQVLFNGGQCSTL